ncbi:MAG: DUF5689 domain-containing protein [Candidatus Pedobacter colombiensis]|uniref:DUF5689 domain-containing protein n=1 Tax=Candidatus Pedobacter colombiensis TaxID=3121371 RepID=A0AAJ6B729_9SPHI|nr:DUF5689 domain-containing protein [Pedobacter sp.]WEK19815.1 MAG: DUF5689 domain-containing protein [Pedobacter sp.]
MKKIFYLILIVTTSIGFSSCLKENINNSIGTPNPMVSIYVIRDAFKDADLKLEPSILSGAHVTSGVVISENGALNLPAGSIVIQSTWRNLTRGIVLDVDPTVAANYKRGDSILVDLKSAVLGSNQGSLQIKGITGDQITKVSANNAIVTRSLSINDIATKFSQYESTMISITGDINPLPVSGETFAGKKVIGTGANTLNLFTEQNAVFAKDKIAPSATFVGILYQQGEPQLRLQKYADMLYPSGPIYQGYPESFESPLADTKSGYASAVVQCGTGPWTLNNCLLGETSGRDRIVTGKQAIRFQQNLTTSAYLQMNYDLPNGASKVTVWYGCYYTDASSSWQLQYSTNGGTTWTAIGNVYKDAAPTNEGLTPKMATIMMDIKVPVRFRVNKLGLGATSIPTVYNGRLGMDDFAVYKSY